RPPRKEKIRSEEKLQAMVHTSQKLIIFANGSVMQSPARGDAADSGRDAIAPPRQRQFARSSVYQNRQNIDISAEPHGEECPSPVALLSATPTMRRAYIRTGRGATYSSLSSGKGVWRYLIYKDVEQRSLTSLAY
ncbi:MAG: hypothetical protein K2I64_07365, partial [Muribaculaceae bacterium]|nr:hypothetical protein [Muribaculaceae bacterium]